MFQSYTRFLTLTLQNHVKSDQDYLQNRMHMVLRNRLASLSIGTERLACLINIRGVLLKSLAGVLHASFSPPSLPSPPSTPPLWAGLKDNIHVG